MRFGERKGTKTTFNVFLRGGLIKQFLRWFIGSLVGVRAILLSNKARVQGLEQYSELFMSIHDITHYILQETLTSCIRIIVKRLCTIKVYKSHSSLHCIIKIKNKRNNKQLTKYFEEEDHMKGIQKVVGELHME